MNINHIFTVRTFHTYFITTFPSIAIPNNVSEIKKIFYHTLHKYIFPSIIVNFYHA